MGARQSQLRLALRLEYFTIGWNVLEAFVAIGSGLLAGSIALVGFGLDSVIEVLAASMLLWRLRMEHLDQGRAEDHARAERKALFVVGGTFLALALYIVYEAATMLLRREAPETSTAGIVLACLSLAVMPVLGLRKLDVARRLKSRALRADAMETLVCSYLSFTLLLGLGLNAWRGWWWADPLAALAMLPLVVHEGWEALEHAREQ